MNTADLLTPTLTEEDDAMGFERPWAPWSLVFATFFVGPFGGAVLFGWNEKRLGRPRRMWTPALVFVPLGLVLWATWAAVVSSDMDWARDHRRMADIIGDVIAVLVAMAFARTQARRFGVFEQSSSDDAGHLFGWGVALFILKTIVEFGVMVAMFAAFGVDVGTWTDR